MKEWNLYPADAAAIKERFRETAASYTPEWNFRPGDPDIGTALALAYADMLEGTVRQMERIGYKNQLAFFNSLQADLKEAVPARGYAVFSISEDAPEGTEIDAHTTMMAEVDGGEGNAQYETLEDLYATPARPSCLYLTDGKKDGIYHISENIQGEGAVVLFREKGDSLQRHELLLAHDELLNIRQDARIEIAFYVRPGQPVERRLLEALADPEAARFTYWSEGEWRPFDGVSVLENHILLRKKAQSPAFTELEELESCVLRCEALDISRLRDLSVEEIRLTGRGDNLAPESICGAGLECSQREYYPFGERLNLYEEVYFGSEEALTKRGAQITLSFYMDFVQIPLEQAAESNEIQWKWVMKRSDFRPDPEYDVMVQQVLWEYFNGTGWSRLFLDDRFGDVFFPKEGTISRQKTIRFLCPRDMAPILVGATETCYIRARILKVSNLYKLKGRYIIPVLSNTTFSYTYQGEGVRPGQIMGENNRERYRLGVREELFSEPLHPYVGTETGQKALYLGFEQAPVGAPIRMLLVLEDMLQKEQGSIGWEYLSTRGWKDLNLADGTRSLSRTGLVTFVGPADISRESRFGKELYWIRLRDESDYYTKERKELKYPVLKQIWMNAAQIRHMDRLETEYFTIDGSEESTVISLMRGNIIELTVEVLEGAEEEANWTVWQEVRCLDSEAAGAKVYQIDRIQGVLRFGNGTHGQTPPIGREEGIRVRYKSGGGSGANAGPGQVNRLNETFGYVTGVWNPEALFGGLDVESTKEALRRNGARLRHRGRAITARDYEELAMEASRVLEKVRCFGGRNAGGEREAGAVTLVALPKGFRSDKSLFHSVQTDIINELAPRMEPGILAGDQFAVTLPQFVEIEVRLELVVRSFHDIFQVRRRVQDRLRDFLDPVKGHFDGKGWEIGTLPAAMQIQNVVKEIPEIIWIRKMYLLTFVSGEKGRQEVDPDRIREHPYVLPVSGNHEINVFVEKTGQ